MKSQKKRSEISDEYKWDLTKIYKSDEDWYKDLDKVKTLQENISNYKENLYDSSKTLKEFIELEEKIDSLYNKLGTYVVRKSDEDTTVPKYKKMLQEFSDTSNRYSELTSFENELFFKQDYNKVVSLLNEDEKLGTYLFFYEKNNRYREHYLDEEKTKIVTLFNDVVENPNDTYCSLTDTDLKFNSIKDESGKEIELTESNYSNFIRSHDRRVRKDAFNELLNTYSKYKNTITSTYLGDINATIANSKIYNYNSCLEQSLYKDNLNIKVYNNLIDSVSSKLSYLYKYYDFKKKTLGLDEFHLYDSYVSIIDTVNKKYSYEEAKKLVLDTVSILGDDYVSIIKHLMADKLIDVYNNVGKRGGAYSAGNFDTEPYILLNYEGNLDDVSTLAHELGHSAHTYLTTHNNYRPYGNYAIFVAEIASTVNELLLANHLLDVLGSDEEKLVVLNNLLDTYKGTIYRQTMFAEFEKGIYEKREAGDGLTHEIISDYYYDLNKKYFGPNVVVDEKIKYEWERIPHFYYNFYVYKYATGLSIATKIVSDILNNKENAVENYKKFLKSGSSMYVTDLLKIVGINIEESNFIDEALDEFNNILDKFIKLKTKKEKK